MTRQKLFEFYEGTEYSPLRMGNPSRPSEWHLPIQFSGIKDDDITNNVSAKEITFSLSKKALKSIRATLLHEALFSFYKSFYNYLALRNIFWHRLGGLGLTSMLMDENVREIIDERNVENYSFDGYRQLDVNIPETSFLGFFERNYLKDQSHLVYDETSGSFFSAWCEIYNLLSELQIGELDRETGEENPAEAFVGILPCSQYTFVEASESQQRDELIGSMRRCVEYFGGVTEAIVSDGLKSAELTKGQFIPTTDRSVQAHRPRKNSCSGEEDSNSRF